MNKHLFAILLICFMLRGCEKDFNPESLPPNNNKYHYDNVTSNQRWSADVPHVIEKEIYIQHAILKIEPGTTIKFKEGAAISVMNSAGLIADGSEKPIYFTSEVGSAGYWKYIYFGSNAIEDSCILINCKFDYGGSDENWPATIYCQQISPTIMNCEIKNSISNGIYLDGNCLSIKFKNNRITLNEQSPIATAACNIPAIDAVDYTGNKVDCIKIVEGTLTTDATWHNLTIPYHFRDDITINRATLTISEGTSLKFASQQRLNVVDYGCLIANGNPNAEIIFSAITPTDEFWDCLYFDNTSSGNLQNCVIEYGGQNDQYPANIYIDNAQVNIINCKIKNSNRYGIYINGKFSANFYNNLITNNRNAPISSPAVNVPNLFNNNFTGNGGNYIEIRGGTAEDEINITSYWENLGVPYRILDFLDIRSATVHLAGGVTLEMGNNSSINIVEGGGLIADGSGSLITITGTDKSPGSWNCIYFSNTSNDAHCLLKNCLVEYGGGNSNMPGIIYCEDASPTISNCYIENSLYYGIYLTGNSNPILDNNYFNNNLGGSRYP